MQDEHFRSFSNQIINLHELSVVKTAIYVDFGSAVRVATFKGTLHINVSDKIFHTAMCCAEATITRWQASCFPNSIRLYIYK